MNEKEPIKQEEITDLEQESNQEPVRDLLPTKINRFSSSLLTGSEKEEVLNLIEILTKNSKHLKIENKVDAFYLALKAKELDIPLGTALDHCNYVNGRVGIDSHIIRAKLLNSTENITWECISDYSPTFKYSDGQRIFSEDELPSNFEIVSKIKDENITSKVLERGNYPVVILAKDGIPIIDDRITKFKFTRRKKSIENGEEVFKDIIEFGEFRYSDAVKADLIKPKSAWNNYPRIMMKHRAFTFGARAIAADLLLGMNTVDELYDIEGKTYDVKEDNIIVVD